MEKEGWRAPLVIGSARLGRQHLPLYFLVTVTWLSERVWTHVTLQVCLFVSIRTSLSLRAPNDGMGISAESLLDSHR